VAVADEVYRLQNGADDECRFFQRVAAQGHYGPGGGTKQGIYCLTPSGKLLASANTHSADRVAEMLHASLEAWEGLGDEDRRLPRPDVFAATARWEDNVPTDGLVLESLKRDLPDSLDPSDGKTTGWNRDFAWFSAAEMRGFLPRDCQSPDPQFVAQALVEGLARFHLVDNVRGQTLPFARSEVAGSWMTVRVIGATQSELVLEYRGEGIGRSDGPWLLGENYWKPGRVHPHAIHVQLHGTARWSEHDQRFKAFELLALGTREGRTIMNGRRDDAASPIGISFALADPAGPRVAPTFVNLYEGDWITVRGQVEGL
jgi:hypothetical protein